MISRYLTWAFKSELKYRVPINDCRVKPTLQQNIYYCVAFSKQMPNLNALLTVTSDINDVLFALFSFLIQAVPKLA
jgi:hypothetical protein